MSGDFLHWISTPEEHPLPPLKYLDDEAIESIEAAKSGKYFRSKSKIERPAVALVTDSANISSSTDTFGRQGKAEEMTESDSEESFLFDQLDSAFSYYRDYENDSSHIIEQLTSHESLGTISSAISRSRRNRQIPSSAKAAASRKCVSCPEAAHVADGDVERSCLEVSRRKDNRLVQSMNSSLLRKYEKEDISQPLDTTTLESIDVYRFNQDHGPMDSFVCTTTYNGDVPGSQLSTGAANTDNTDSNDSYSSINFSNEDSIDYNDDCSRSSFISLYRSSPIECMNTDATAASLEVLAGPVMLTYINYTQTVKTALITPVQQREKRNLCRTCRLDGLKYNPACPSSGSVPKKSTFVSAATRPEDGTSELCVVYS